MYWVVGRTESNGCIIYDEQGNLVTIGTATIVYFGHNGTDLLFLQDDLTSMTSTANTISISYDADTTAFKHDLEIPSSMASKTITMIVYDTNGKPVWSESHYVTLSDMDEVEVSAPGASVGGH